MNVQVIAGLDGVILWVSGAMPGKIHDLTAARVWGIPRELEKVGILTLADKDYQGIEGTIVVTPYKGKNKPESQKRAN
ncbi:transposase family protein [Streptosporangium jomthongense]|uniref:Transposase family protein n=1 Tax=Streptosporangium jomthongense TaxID=1193683 RepID=A0ABV8EZ56_9ACTN